MTERRPIVLISGVLQELPVGDTLPGGGGGGSGPVVGTAILDFGTFPGNSHTSVDVTGQSGIGVGSTVLAWLRYAASTDHSADEHLVETIKIIAGNIIAGIGFTIYGFNTSQLNEPVDPRANRGGMGTLLSGQWSVSWQWS